MRVGGLGGCLGRRGLSGALGKSAERLGVAHGDVGQHLAVQLDARQLQAVDERRVRHALGARGGVDARDPEAAEVPLAVAAVAVRVGVRLHDRFLGALVGGVRLAAEALRPLQDLAALLAGVHGALDAGHRPLPPSSLLTTLRSAFEISRSSPISRLRFGDFFSRMWLENAWRPCSLPVAVFLKRFFAPEWDFIFGMRAAEYSLPPVAIPTSLVGSYAQPEWLIDREKLRGRFPPRVRARELWRVPPEYLEEALDDATRLAIADQERAGLDIITDGEMRRESYSNRFATALEGVDVDNPGTALDRSGHPNPVPRVVGPVARRHAVQVRDLEFLKAHTRRPVKI